MLSYLWNHLTREKGRGHMPISLLSDFKAPVLKSKYFDLSKEGQSVPLASTSLAIGPIKYDTEVSFVVVSF